MTEEDDDQKKKGNDPASRIEISHSKMFCCCLIQISGPGLTFKVKKQVDKIKKNWAIFK